MTLSLDLLRTFLAVYRDGSLTRAAQRLSLSQPAVTAQLKTLEAELGRPLFTRLSRGVEPTPAAELLAARVADPLDRLAALTLVEPADPFANPVHLGGPAEFTTARVLPALADLVATGLRLRTRLGVADELGQALTGGAIDIAVTPVRPRHRGLHVRPLCDETFVLVAAPRWAERLPTDATDADCVRMLAGVPLISYAENLPIIRRYWQTVFDVRPRLEAAVVVPDLNAVKSAVIAGAGFSVLPDYLCGDALRTGDLVLLREPPVPPINTLFLAARAAMMTNPTVATVYAHLLARAGLQAGRRMTPTAAS
jgi:DNA-binding transcriptional LysR family regulator